MYYNINFSFTQDMFSLYQYANLERSIACNVRIIWTEHKHSQADNRMVRHH